MTQVRQTRQTTEWPMPDGAREVSRRDPGWLFFAGSLAILAGAFQFITGLTALLRSGYFAVGSNSLLVHVSYNVWGWSHIGVGAALVLLGLGAMFRLPMARAIGVAVALVAAVVNIGFLAAFPLWMFLNIALDVIVIYGLARHWNDWVTGGLEAMTRGATAARTTEAQRVGTTDGQETRAPAQQRGPSVSGEQTQAADRDEVRAAADRARGRRS